MTIKTYVSPPPTHTIAFKRYQEVSESNWLIVKWALGRVGGRQGSVLYDECPHLSVKAAMGEGIAPGTKQ